MSDICSCGGIPKRLVDGRCPGCGTEYGKPEVAQLTVRRISLCANCRQEIKTAGQHVIGALHDKFEYSCQKAEPNTVAVLQVQAIQTDVPDAHGDIIPAEVLTMGAALDVGLEPTFTKEHGEPRAIKRPLPWDQRGWHPDYGLEGPPGRHVEVASTEPAAPYAQAWTMLRETWEHVDDAMNGWGDKPSERLSGNELRDRRSKALQALIADATALWELIRRE